MMHGQDNAMCTTEIIHHGCGCKTNGQVEPCMSPRSTYCGKCYYHVLETTYCKDCTQFYIEAQKLYSPNGCRIN